MSDDIEQELNELVNNIGNMGNFSEIGNFNNANTNLNTNANFNKENVDLNVVDFIGVPDSFPNKNGKNEGNFNANSNQANEIDMSLERLVEELNK